MRLRDLVHGGANHVWFEDLVCEKRREMKLMIESLRPRHRLDVTPITVTCDGRPRTLDCIGRGLPLWAEFLNSPTSCWLNDRAKFVTLLVGISFSVFLMIMMLSMFGTHHRHKSFPMPYPRREQGIET
jgi:hypothetical protein